MNDDQVDDLLIESTTLIAAAALTEMDAEMLDQTETETESQSSEEDDSDDMSSESLSWIKWFCCRAGNELFIQVPYDWVEDSFNLTDLELIIPNIESALNIILDYEVDNQTYESSEQDAQLLYGLIHARYILSKQGLNDIFTRYSDNEYGGCPRALCENASLLPMGINDVLGAHCVKMYCSQCKDIYHPKQKYTGIDGCFFGPTFPHLFEMAYADQIAARFKDKERRVFVPKIYGFKVHESSCAGSRSAWLRNV